MNIENEQLTSNPSMQVASLMRSTWVVSVFLILIVIAAIGCNVPQDAKKLFLFPTILFLLTVTSTALLTKLCHIRWTLKLHFFVMILSLLPYSLIQYSGYQSYVRDLKSTMKPMALELVTNMHKYTGENDENLSKEDKENLNRLSQEITPAFPGYLKWKYSKIIALRKFPAVSIFITETVAALFISNIVAMLVVPYNKAQKKVLELPAGGQQ